MLFRDAVVEPLGGTREWITRLELFVRDVPPREAGEGRVP